MTGATTAPQQQPSSRPNWAASLCACLLLLVLLALAAGADPVRDALRYDRQAIAAGQWWRLLTAHLVHLGWAHALLNGMGILLCAGLAPAVFACKKLLLLMLFLGTGIGVLMYGGYPGIGRYVGFSGVLYGLFVVGLWPQRHDALMRCALILVLGWASWQLLLAPLPSEEQMIGGRIVAEAHFLGVLLAGAWLMALAGIRKMPRPHPPN